MKLTETSLPDKVRIGANNVPIRTDFRIGMKFESMVWDKKIEEGLKVPLSLVLYYGEAKVPCDIEDAYNAILWFFKGGDTKRHSKNTSAKRIRRILDYDIDAELIYAAFLDQYHVDLNETEHLHWWKFRAMLAGLREDHKISKIIGYRAVDTTKIKDKNERARLSRLQALYCLSEHGEGDMVKKAGIVFG